MCTTTFLLINTIETHSYICNSLPLAQKHATPKSVWVPAVVLISWLLTEVFAFVWIHAASWRNLYHEGKKRDRLKSFVPVYRGTSDVCLFDTVFHFNVLWHFPLFSAFHSMSVIPFCLGVSVLCRLCRGSQCCLLAESGLLYMWVHVLTTEADVLSKGQLDTVVCVTRFVLCVLYTLLLLLFGVFSHCFFVNFIFCSESDKKKKLCAFSV